MSDAVLGVVGGSGGVGASTFAAVLATVAGGVLVDLDPVGGGVDVLLGIENEPGARWSGLRLGGGHLDPALLADGLPRWGAVTVLAADTPPPSVAAVASVLAAAAVLGPVVVDIGRGPSAERAAAVDVCCFVVALAVAEVRGLVPARAVLTSLGAAPAGVVVRRGSVPGDQAAALAGAPLVGELPPITARHDRALDPARLPRASARVAAGVLDGVLP